jgi:Ca-activated chloride channel family protein
VRTTSRRQLAITGRRTSLVYCLLFLAGTATLPALPQTATTREDIAVTYVLVPFVPLDASGRPIRELRRQDVTLYVDGASVAFDMFEQTRDAAVSYTILLDVSGSMALAGKMAGARTAVNALLSTRQAGDDFSLWTFADGEVEQVVPFTEEGSAIMSAVLRMEPYGKTALHDALARMPDQTLLGRNGSRAIILLTDAIDNASVITRAELTRILESVDVPIYPLGLRPRALQDRAAASPEHWTDLEMLQQIAGATGGRALVSSDLSELERGIAAIQSDLRSQFLIGFAPTGRGSIRFRRIALGIAGRHRSARVRAGYRGTEPPISKEREKS